MNLRHPPFRCSPLLFSFPLNHQHSTFLRTSHTCLGCAADEERIFLDLCSGTKTAEGRALKGGDSGEELTFDPSSCLLPLLLLLADLQSTQSRTLPPPLAPLTSRNNKGDRSSTSSGLLLDCLRCCTLLLSLISVCFSIQDTYLPLQPSPSYPSSLPRPSHPLLVAAGLQRSMLSLRSLLPSINSIHFRLSIPSYFAPAIHYVFLRSFIHLGGRWSACRGSSSQAVAFVVFVRVSLSAVVSLGSPGAEPCSNVAYFLPFLLQRDRPDFGDFRHLPSPLFFFPTTSSPPRLSFATAARFFDPPRI